MTSDALSGWSKKGQGFIMRLFASGGSILTDGAGLGTRDRFTAGKNCQENMSKGSNFQDYCRLIVGRVDVVSLLWGGSC